MASCATDLANSLARSGTIAGVTWVLGKNLFIGTERDTEGVDTDCATFYDTGGAAGDLSDYPIEEASVQIQVRSENYLRGEYMARGLWYYFHDLSNMPNSPASHSPGYYYFSLTSTSDILSLGEDESKRARFTANFRIQRQLRPVTLSASVVGVSDKEPAGKVFRNNGLQVNLPSIVNIDTGSRLSLDRRWSVFGAESGDTQSFIPLEGDHTYTPQGQSAVRLLNPTDWIEWRLEVSDVIGNQTAITIRSVAT